MVLRKSNPAISHVVVASLFWLTGCVDAAPKMEAGTGDATSTAEPDAMADVSSQPDAMADVSSQPDADSGVILTTVDGGSDPDATTPSSWSEAWSTRDYATIQSWYRTNTGIAAAGMTEADLTASGSIKTSRDGQVIEGLLVTGSIVVVHENVTIRNVMVVNDGGTIAINIPFGSEVSSLTLENVSLIGRGGAAKYQQAVGGTYLQEGVRATRVYINGFGNGFRLSHHGSDSVDLSMVENIRVHAGSHNTGTSFRGGHGKSLTRCWIEGSTSSALSLYPDASAITAFEARQNLFDGGTYSIIGGDNKTYGSQTSASFVDNLFTRAHQYGPLASFDRSLPDRTWTGNMYLDGTAIN